MKSKTLGILLSLVLVVTFSLVTAVPASAATITVGGGGDHATIQAAIDAASPGDTITVAAGTYAENVVIDKALTLQGATGATIAPTTLIAVEITASSVTVDGFTITPLGTGVNLAQGITLSTTGSGVTISNNTITTVGQGGHGIYVSVSSTGLTVTDNNITVAGVATAIYADAGPLQTVKSSGWTISGNTLEASNASGGVNLELYDVDAVTVDNNTFKSVQFSNIIVSSELFNLTGPIVFTNNDVQGNVGGSMVAFVTDFQQHITATRSDGINTAMDDVTITGNTFAGWASRALRIGDWGGAVTNVVVNSNTFNMTTAVEVIGGKDAPSATGTGNIFNVSSPATIQDAINSAFSGDTISVADGTYAEDLVIPAGKDNLELAGATGATIKGVVQRPDAEWPYADPNINILSFGVRIHGFTIEGPDAVADEYASGMLIGAPGVEISYNDFRVTAGRATWAGSISLGIQTYRKTATAMENVDISGLNIHHNTFTNLGLGAAGFDAIFVNLDTGTGTATIADNEFTGNVARAISAERSNMVISGNSIVTDLAPYASAGGFQGIYIGCFPVGEDPGPVQSNVLITRNTVKGATTSEGFAQGIRVGNTTGPVQEGLEDITVLRNTVQDCDEGITVRVDASGVSVNYNSITGNNVGVQNDDTANTLDAECNWWGDIAGPDTTGNIMHNPYESQTGGNGVSDYVDYLPWLIRIDLVVENDGWNIASFPIRAAQPAEPPPPPEEIVAIYWFDSSTQYWNLDPYQAGPLDAMYVKVTAPISFIYPVSSEATMPSQKAMKVGWNFVGLAQLYAMDLATEALSDAYYGTGETNLVGYNKVISPSLNGVSWTHIRDGATYNILPTKGYWVLMVNDGVLGGFTTTPIVEEVP